MDQQQRKPFRGSLSLYSVECAGRLTDISTMHIQCPRQRTTGLAVQHADIPPHYSATLDFTSQYVLGKLLTISHHSATVRTAYNTYFISDGKIRIIRVRKMA